MAAKGVKIHPIMIHNMKIIQREIKNSTGKELPLSECSKIMSFQIPEITIKIEGKRHKKLKADGGLYERIV